MPLFHKSTPAPARDGAATAPAAGDSLVSLIKTAGISLEKHGLAEQRAAVYLVLDRSGSMSHFYRDGSVQHLAEQALGLSANLDDDGIVPLIFFDNRLKGVTDLDLTAYHGAIDFHHQLLGGESTMGGTSYTAAMSAVLNHHARRTDPAFVIFQTDGQPGDGPAASVLLQKASRSPVFWSFVGFGPSPVPYLQRLDDLPGRAVDNASYLHVGNDPLSYADAALYDGITAQFGTWLTAARAAGIVQ